ncbi:unnamed protein product [Fraxinus pennsylvanica]|uniref:Uncharacterized protein n=1 Tax=Fraxinus pennsylvanica TaxID=56036 RepID=A0AAD1ZAX6_9LAMI|nr:unnamed protein product [Fraxinus pennsylvanica]
MPNSRGHPSLPNFLYYQSNLGILHLPNNSIGQNFPTWLLENNTRLRGLYLRDNAFRGPLKLPTSINPNMETFDVSNNKFHGLEDLSSCQQASIPTWRLLRIPTLVGNMTTLKQISLSNNQLEGPIPEEICNPDFLGLLDLSRNNLCGSVPSCFNSSRICHVYLNNNQLEGELTYAFYNSSSLVLLDLRWNKFIGISLNGLAIYQA